MSFMISIQAIFFLLFCSVCCFLMYSCIDTSLQVAIIESKTNHDAAVTEITTNFSESIENLTTIRAELENANNELQTKIASSREEIGQLSSSLADLS